MERQYGLSGCRNSINRVLKGTAKASGSCRRLDKGLILGDMDQIGGRQGCRNRLQTTVAISNQVMHMLQMA